jgi:cytosine deaminase
MILEKIAVPLSLAGDNLGGTLHNQCLHGDLHIVPDAPNRLIPREPSPQARLVIPQLTEAHCHLDKCHSINRLGPIGGDLPQAIEAQAKDHKNWTETDLQNRIGKGFREAVASGCGAIRSHIDWGEGTQPPIAWHVLGDLAKDSDLKVQRSALMGIDKLADSAFCAQVATQVSRSQGGVLGGFVLAHQDRAKGIDNVIKQAIHHSLPLDFHVDETLHDMDGLGLIADAILRLKYEGPVLCGHACNLMNLSSDPLARLIDKLLKAGISICALPTTNLYLQGRTDGTPDRRGITRLRELEKGGVPIVLASDNVADAFCPTGQHDPMAALHLAVLGAHLDPPFDRWLPAITSNARHAMGLTEMSVRTATASDLLISNATSIADLISGREALTSIV